MTKFNDEQRVWNRAAFDAGGPDPREGDRALAAVLMAHGVLMNGGVQHALESLSDSELNAAVEGYRFFSLDAVAQLLTELRTDGLDDDRMAEDADARYADVVPDDNVLLARFSAVFASSPEAFAPI